MKDSDKARELIATGTEIAGAAVGGALGFLAAGPVGAAGAGMLGVIISEGANKVLADFSNRHLSRREEMRIGAAAAFALARIRKRLEDGDKLRGDGFFSQDSNERSSAEEILEGILQKSKNEHEEKKIRLLGNFFANVAFMPDVSANEANHLLRVSEKLTYRQMWLLAILHAKSQMPRIQWLASDIKDAPISFSHGVISLL